VQAGGNPYMDRLKFAIKKGLNIFFGNIRCNFISILSISTLLFFYMAVFSVNYSASQAIDKLTDIKTVRIFLEEGVGQDYMLQRLNELQMPASFKFFSKQEAKTRVINLIPGAKNIEKLPTDLFPEFVEMRFADYAAEEDLILETARNIEQIGGVRSVEYGKRVGEKLKRVKRTSFIFMVFISTLTGLSAAVIMFNTIRLSLYRFQKKIMVYTLVGATRMFVTVPYLFSSLLESTLAFILAGAGNYIFVSLVTSYLLKDSYFLLFVPHYSLYLFFYLVLVGIGIISSFICVYTFLARLKSINEI
jgi:cell division transport system permease protein